MVTAWVTCVALLVTLSTGINALDPSDPWFNNKKLPNVDLEGLIAKMNKKISWFEYIGNITLRCANLAKEQDTLMLAVEILHDCLDTAYRKCASEHAQEKGCKSPFVSVANDACGAIRLGDPMRMFYGENMDCFWHLQVPPRWIMNLTIDQFDMEYGSMACPYDYAMIYDGNSTDAKAYGRFCGRIPKFTIYGTSNLMLVMAHTDESVGKYGFRAVFQVMDPGLGITNTENEQYLTGDDGSFDLANTPFVFFETWETGYYYTRWHIRTDISKRLQLQIHYHLPKGSEVAIYDGTSDMNPIVKRLTTRPGRGSTYNYTESASHQLFIQVTRRELTDGAIVRGIFHSLDVKPSFADLHTTELGCEGPAVINLDKTESVRIGIDPVRLSRGVLGMAVQCFWNITAPKGHFVQVRFHDLEFNNYNTRDCQEEGLVFLDGPSFRQNKLRLGPYCYEDPRGLFSRMAGGVNNITSTGSHFFIAYYSFINYTQTSWSRGSFVASVSATSCQGFFQPCDRPEGIEETDHYRAVKRVEGNTSEVDFHCEKGKCCVLQQIATYANMSVSQCHVALYLKGPKISATSKFVSNMVIYQKNDTTMAYSCQRTDAVRDVIGGSPLHQECLGTQAFLTYGSESIWSMGSFHVSVEDHECGVYRAGVHTSNELYPPCATAYLPVSTDAYSVRFVDPAYQPNTYYAITFSYAHKDCPSQCVSERFEVWDEFAAFAWSEVPRMPFEYKTWPMSSEEAGANWTRVVVIERTEHLELNDSACDNVPRLEKFCELQVSIKPYTKLDDVWRSTAVTCRPGYEVVGMMCLKVYFPHTDADEPGPLPLDYNLTAAQAERACREDEGGHLADLDDGDTFRALRWHAFFAWWKKYLKYVPGMKIFHVGLNDIVEKDAYYWNDGRKAYDFNDHWHFPLPDREYPDVTLRRAADGEEVELDVLRSRYLRDALTQVHPTYDQEARCTVLVYDNPHYDQGTLLKVPCDLEIPAGLALCRTPPITIPDDLAKGKTFDLSALQEQLTEKIQDKRRQFHSEVVPTRLGNELRVATKECPPNYVLIWEMCYFLKTQPRIAPTMRNPHERREITKDTMVSKCRDELGRPAVFTEDSLPTLRFYIQLWRHRPEDGSIRIAHLSSEPKWAADSSRARCHVMEPVKSTKFNKTVYDWELKSLNPDNECDREQGATSFMCEVGPRSSGEQCQKHHRRCGDGSCLVAHYWCDGAEDCLDKSDEASCPSACEPKPGFLPPQDCFRDCHRENCTCTDLYFQCRWGGCIPASKICNRLKDCPDGSDEDICDFPNLACKADQLQCSPGECVDKDKVCDLKQDCINGADEKDCEPDPETHCPRNDALLANYFRCPGQQRCFPQSYMNDFIADCADFNKSDEANRVSLFLDETNLKRFPDNSFELKKYVGYDCHEFQTSCNSFSDLVCYNRAETCIRDLDVYGRSTQCRQGEHMRNCQLVQCPSMFKCPNSFCIPLKSVCDQKRDCENGDDELHCENLYCPNLLRCSGGNKCVRFSEICDGKYDCPLYKDDEELCDMRDSGCPSWCDCLGDAADCSARNQSDKALLDGEAFSNSLKIMVISHNSFTQLPDLTNWMGFLYRLDVSHNKLQILSTRTFVNKRNLRELYLHDNELQSLPQPYFTDLHNLKVLTLHNNMINHIDTGVFDGLSSLPVLDLSRQKIRTLESFIFQGLLSIDMIDLSYNEIATLKNNSFSNKRNGQPVPLETLRFLYINNNPIAEAVADAFTMLPPRMFLKTDRHKFCCFAIQVKNCEPGPDEFSSCNDLMSSLVLRTVLWGMGILAFIGNAVVVQQRIKREKETTPSILVQHLAVADFMMGFYLLIIGGADAHLRGHFNAHTDTWKAHALCRLAAFLYNLSSMMSPFILLLITADRMYATLPSCRAHGLNLRSARALLALGWTASVVTSVAPILEFSYFGAKDYVRTGACIIFQLTEGTEDPAWIYGMSVFLWANAVCVCVMGFGYLASVKAMRSGVEIFEHTLTEDMTEEEKTAERLFRENEMVITRRLMVMVLSNFFVWVPLLLISAFSLLGLRVDKITAAWVAVFVAPLNSALNPFLFTFSGKPYRGRVDVLLANWVEQEYQEEDEFAEAAAHADMVTKADYQQAILREML